MLHLGVGTWKLGIHTYAAFYYDIFDKISFCIPIFKCIHNYTNLTNLGKWEYQAV